MDDDEDEPPERTVNVAMSPGLYIIDSYITNPHPFQMEAKLKPRLRRVHELLHRTHSPNSVQILARRPPRGLLRTLQP